MVTTLWYYADTNHFVTDDGYVVFDIFNYITPNMLFLFRYKKEWMIFETKPGVFVELFYPEEANELDY